MHRNTERKGTKRRMIISILLVWVGLSCGGKAGAQARNKSAAPKNSCVVPKDEIQVFIAYELYYHQPTVIVMQTEVRHLDVDTLNLELIPQGHAIPADLRTDFKTK